MKRYRRNCQYLHTSALVTAGGICHYRQIVLKLTG
jgi:hypothetical protein